MKTLTNVRACDLMAELELDEDMVLESAFQERVERKRNVQTRREGGTRVDPKRNRQMKPARVERAWLQEAF